MKPERGGITHGPFARPSLHGRGVPRREDVVDVKGMRSGVRWRASRRKLSDSTSGIMPSSPGETEPRRGDAADKG
jgi:hypothetical protein